MLSIFIDGVINAVFDVGAGLMWLTVILVVVTALYCLVRAIEVMGRYHQSEQYYSDALNEKASDMAVIREYSAKNALLKSTINYHKNNR